MMATSLRVLSRALGYRGRVSIATDVLGFWRGRVPTAIDPSRPNPAVSIREHVASLRQPRIKVCLIIAGADLVQGTHDEQVIDYAVHRLREIYGRAGIGVEAVRRVLTDTADAKGHDSVLSDADIGAAAKDLTVPGHEVPVILPANMTVTTTNPDKTVTVTLGRSPVNGKCGDRDEDESHSAVVSLSGEETARTLAHEIGHFLGLEHPATASQTLMTQTGSVPGDPFDAVAINDGDVLTIKKHCSMNHSSIMV